MHFRLSSVSRRTLSLRLPTSFTATQSKTGPTTNADVPSASAVHSHRHVTLHLLCRLQARSAETHTSQSLPLLLLSQDLLKLLISIRPLLIPLTELIDVTLIYLYYLCYRFTMWVTCTSSLSNTLCRIPLFVK